MSLRFSTGLRNRLLGNSGSWTAPVNITGITIVGAPGSAAGAGTLAFTKSTNTFTWAPYGGSAGAGVAITEDGTYVLRGSAGALVVTADFSEFPSGNATDTITVTADSGDGLAGVFFKSFIDVYSGSPPASADGAPVGTKLATFSVDAGATGLTFGTPADGAVSKASAENWKATGIAAGTAGWFRLRTASDDNQAGTTYPRIDGLVARSGADMNMSNTSITVSSPHTIDTFTINVAAN